MHLLFIMLHEDVHSMVWAFLSSLKLQFYMNEFPADLGGDKSDKTTRSNLPFPLAFPGKCTCAQIAAPKKTHAFLSSNYILCLVLTKLRKLL